MEITEVYTQFQRSLLTYIRSKIKSKEDAEDILHNVFIKIVNHSEKLSDRENLQAWIFTIARNSIIDYYRMNASKNKSSIDDMFEEQIAEEEAADSTKGLDQCLSGMINSLPEEYKHIIMDSEIHGIRQKELATKYNMAYPTMRSRVQRGRDRLKQLLVTCCSIEADRHGNILDVQSKNNCTEGCDPCAE